MNIINILLKLFIYISTGIIWAFEGKKWRLSPILSGFLGFLFIPILFNMLPFLYKKRNKKSSNDQSFI
ncbi:hypothetical protein FQB35_05700 [Crassaminicella thermophila]|uniref:Uncharacterized protein n=1 Tax=Crassaminicella thermophila TaxID=2599308 RepID=A0A5C0SBG7_CRATE|nr:hypothetical protein [Crassaminicella thermophila]QEK11903.1 hypothetical protein FQB35_05700 [Crassaminicella thermophila]